MGAGTLERFAPSPAMDSITAEELRQAIEQAASAVESEGGSPAPFAALVSQNGESREISGDQLMAMFGLQLNAHRSDPEVRQAKELLATVLRLAAPRAVAAEGESLLAALAALAQMLEAAEALYLEEDRSGGAENKRHTELIGSLLQEVLKNQELARLTQRWLEAGAGGEATGGAGAGGGSGRGAGVDAVLPLAAAACRLLLACCPGTHYLLADWVSEIKMLEVLGRWAQAGDASQQVYRRARRRADLPGRAGGREPRVRRRQGGGDARAALVDRVHPRRGGGGAAVGGAQRADAVEDRRERGARAPAVHAGHSGADRGHPGGTGAGASRGHARRDPAPAVVKLGLCAACARPERSAAQARQDRRQHRRGRTPAVDPERRAAAGSAVDGYVPAEHGGQEADDYKPVFKGLLRRKRRDAKRSSSTTRRRACAASGRDEQLVLRCSALTQKLPVCIIS